MPSTLHIENASLAFGKKIIFSDINFNLAAKNWVALVGPSGIGKSSLLRLIAGLTTPNEITTGHIYTNNALPLTQQIAYMAQTDLLLPWLSVLENVVLGNKLRSYKKVPETLMDFAKSLLTKVKLQDAMHLYPHQLSGGMRQRVALVRTLIENKPIVLMDEPFSALDAITRFELQALATQLLKDKTVFFITHDPAEALRLAHQIYIMQGTPAILCEGPTLHSEIPRDLSNPEIVKWHTILFKQLLEAS